MKNIFPLCNRFLNRFVLATVCQAALFPLLSAIDSDLPVPESASPAAPLTAGTLKSSASEEIPAKVKLKAPTIISPDTTKDSKEISSVNFNNVAMIEYIRFMSRLANKNFIFDDDDLLFNVTIVSEEATSVDNLMAALLQELRIRDLSLIEQGNNIIIHRNPKIRSPGRVVDGKLSFISSTDSEIVTRVFRLNTLDPIKASEIIRPLLSDDALVEVLRDTNNLIITDLVANINKVTDLVQKLDSPNSGVKIGQYVVRNAFVDSLVSLATQILQPIAQGNPFILLPHAASNSIYIVSNGFIVEKGLAILQNLDLNEGKTKIYSLEELYPSNLLGPDGKPIRRPSISINPEETEEQRVQREAEEAKKADLDKNVQNLLQGVIDPSKAQSFSFGPGGFGTVGANQGGESGNRLDSNGFNSNGIGANGLDGRFPEGFLSGGIGSNSAFNPDLSSGHVEGTVFSIYKLRYRRGDQIELALRKIGQSLQVTGTTNVDFISAINSVQWLESSNALILTGSAPILEKIKELIVEIDVPLRQVFIEMLILQTTINDSLEYGVDWAVASDGPGILARQTFLGDALAAAGGFADFSTNPPTINNFGANSGYRNFILGKSISRNGKQYSTFAALIKALHNNTKSKILHNPKIVTEDNYTATFFVGTTDRYKTQSIANDFGNVITNNFQFIDVGTKISITPLIGNDDTITLIIEQETSNGSEGANDSSSNTSDTDVNLIPVISKSQTSTRIHMPNGFFVILSGMIQDQETRSDIRIPCLGGVPILGALSKQKANVDTKTNLMLFIRPLIVDTEQELEDITKRQQDIYDQKCKFRRNNNYEVDEALDLLNIRSTDPDDIKCP